MSRGCAPSRKALESFSPRVLRIMFALAPWEKSMTYSDTAVAEAQRKEEVLRSFFARTSALLRKFGHAAAPAAPGAPCQRLPTRWEVRHSRSFLPCTKSSWPPLQRFSLPPWPSTSLAFA